MFISPISYSNRRTKNQLIKKNNPNFKGPNPVVAKNQLRILYAQDIWAPKLSIKMPQNPMEKEVLLEVLAQRLKLDQLTRLTNEKFSTKAKLSIYKDLRKEDPNSEECKQLKAELDKKGNLKSYFNTLEKRIELAEKKNAPALAYFKEIERLEGEYLKRKLIKLPQIEKFMIQVNKNNINAEGNFSTQELIKIVENGEIPKTTSTLPATQILSKKQLLNTIEAQYEQELRKTVDMYSRNFGHYMDAQKSRQTVEARYQESIKRYPEIRNILSKIYANVERKFTHKVMQVGEVEVYPIGKIIQEMAIAEKAIKRLMTESKDLRAELSANPNNKEAQLALRAREEAIANMKSAWTGGMLYCIKYEGLNREKMAEAGRENVYDYLVGENQILKKLKMVNADYLKNEGNISDEVWEQIVNA